MKRCNRCGVEKPFDCFAKNSLSKDQHVLTCKECTKELYKTRKIRLENGEKINTYPIVGDFKTDIEEWQCGILKGTLCPKKVKHYTFFRGELRFEPEDGGQKATYIPYTTEEEKHDARKKAEEWLFNRCKELNKLEQRIRVYRNTVSGQLDPRYIEVELTQGRTMITDIQFLELCRKYGISVCSFIRNGRQCPHIQIWINGKNHLFHKYITGYDITDHINRNGLDNRLINLRQVSYSQNSSNINITRISNTGIVGISWCEKRKYFYAHITNENKTQFKSFFVSKYPSEEEAKQAAIAWREAEAYKVGNTNGKPPPNIDEL